jgi:uncharacterized Zn finger protein
MDVARVSRETVDAKARRYLAEGRVRIRIVGPNRVSAEVYGTDGAIYRSGLDESGWRCNCPARKECCHISALKLATAP